MGPIKRLIAMPVLALVLYAAACKESASPSTVDPTAMATSLDGLNLTFSQNGAYQNLAILSGHFTFTVPVARPAATLLPPTGAWPPLSVATDYPRMLSLVNRAPGAITAWIPINLRGWTFVWDVALNKYVVDSVNFARLALDRVRFQLYQVDATTGRPTPSLSPSGYVDLIDQSSSLVNALHAQLIVGTMTAADYVISESPSTTTVTDTAVGFVKSVLSADTNSVNIILSHALTLADSSLVTDYRATGKGATVAMHTSFSGAGGSNVVLDWTVEKGGSMEIVGTATPTAINFQFKFNGSTWATVVGDPNGPTFSGANGRQLSTSELLAMSQILRGFGDLASNLNSVFAPARLAFP